MSASDAERENLRAMPKPKCRHIRYLAAMGAKRTCRRRAELDVIDPERPPRFA